MRNRNQRSTIALLVLICLFIFALIIAGKYKSQYRIEPMLSEHTYKQFQMCDENVGWALTTDNKVLYTSDGYENFHAIRQIENVDIASDNFMYADFIDDKTAYIVYFSEIGNKIVVEYTLNAGRSWHYSTIVHGNFGRAHSVYIDFGDKDTGYLLYCSKDDNGDLKKALFRTQNKGEDFESMGDLTTSIEGEPTGICFLNDRKGYIATKNSKTENYLYQTNDGGAIWRTQVLVESNDVYTKTDMYTPFFCGSKKNVGKIILKQSGRYSYQFVLMSTKSSGLAWLKEVVLEFEDIKGFSFIDDSHGFVIDQNGNIHKLIKNRLIDLIKKEDASE